MSSSVNPRHGRVLLVIALLAILAPTYSGYSQPNAEFDERVFLKLRGENEFRDNGTYNSEFFKTLANLAERQKLKADDYLTYRSGPSLSGKAFCLLTDGYAVAINAKEKRFVVAILGTAGLSIPGIAVQQFVLLDQRGKILDKAACEINCRYGNLKTETPKELEKDGAQLVVRFLPRFKNERWHNWHTITFQSKAYTTYVEEDEPQPTEWTTKGLCRIAIRDDKFAVVFPKVEKSDAEVLKEKGVK